MFTHLYLISFLITTYKMVKKASVLLFYILPSVLFSQSNKKLKEETEKLNSDKAMKHAVWSICVMPAKKDTVVYEYNSAVSLIPASTMKVATTGAALSLLGKDFKFETKIKYDGSFDSIAGTIKGNIFIIGGGDPTLESTYFKKENDTATILDKWAAKLKAKGIKRITGGIVGDGSIFSYNITPAQWIWGDMGNYYGAGASGLCYKDNKYTVYFNSGNAGTKAKIVKISEVNNDFWIKDSVIAQGTEDDAYIYGAPYSSYHKMEGTIPPNKINYEVDGSISDPEKFCAEQFRKAIVRAGIIVEGGVQSQKEISENKLRPQLPKKLMFTNYSPSLDSIIHLTNLKSINLFAECILNFLSYKKSGYGNETEGTEIVTDFWKNKGVDVSGFFMNDGCGLARANVITTQTQTQMLRVMAKDKNFNSFYNSLPVAGKSGSLGGMCVGTFAENNLHAKSGYMNRARGYAGYVKNKKGEILCFSLLANNYECTPTEMKRKLEKLLVAIVE